MTDTYPGGRCVAVLRDVLRKLSHQMNNATNGVAVNLEVVRARVARTDEATSVGPFAERASEQLQQVVSMQEIARILVGLLAESVDEERLPCAVSEKGDAIEITFRRATIVRAVRLPGADAGISLRNGPHGVILSVPRDLPSQVPMR